MDYEEKQKKLNHDAKMFLQENLFKYKEELLEKELIDLIQNKAKLLIEKPEFLKVITFEFDSILDFSYCIYPDPNIIAQKHWKDQFIIDCGKKDDYEVLDSLLDEFNLEEWDDAFVSKDDEDYYVDIYELLNELNFSFFRNSWLRAKSITNSSYRGFLFWHDSYNGIDLETGLEAKSENIIEILNKEKFEYRLLED